VGQIAVTTRLFSEIPNAEVRRDPYPREETSDVTFLPQHCRNNMDLSLPLEISEERLVVSQEKLMAVYS
jgi:hypothetical protein